MGGYIKICNKKNTVPELQKLPSSLSCKQTSKSTITILTENESKCCYKEQKCVNTGEFCHAEYKKGVGYYICKNEKKIKEVDISGKMKSKSR